MITKKKKVKRPKKLSAQVKMRLKNEKKKLKDGDYGLWMPPTGTDKFLISTGSTLLDLIITGRVYVGGGIPVGIFVEIFGKSSLGKTILLLELAGCIQRMGGDYLFLDPEGRVNKRFAKVFDFNLEDDNYKMPNTVEAAFNLVRGWKPKGDGPHAIFMDSIAAFESKEESEEKGDEYSGARKAKELSQELRKTCRMITQKDYLLVATNQIRQDMKAGPYGKQTKATGGEAPRYYSSLRLELKTPKSGSKIPYERTIKGVKQTSNIGIVTDVFVEKSTIGTPNQTAPLRILYDYGIDDIIPNLQFLKRNLKTTTYVIGGKKIGQSITDAVNYIERKGLEEELKEEVIDLWTEIQEKMTPKRKRKIRK